MLTKNKRSSRKVIPYEVAPAGKIKEMKGLSARQQDEIILENQCLAEMQDELKNGPKRSIQAPFNMFCIAPTGVGKTFCTTKFVDDICKGVINCQNRFETKKSPLGAPFKFEKIFYLGRVKDDSLDENHNEKLRKLASLGEKPGKITSVTELQKNFMAAIGDGLPIELANEFPGASYGALMVDFIEKHFQTGNLIIIDDLSSIINSMPAGYKNRFLDIFKIGSHHHGGSIIVLLQKCPDKGIGVEMLQNGHYFMFPQPVHIVNGVGPNLSDIHTLMQACVGRSAIWARKLRAATKMIPKPDYLIWNKTQLLSNHDLEKK